MNSIIEPEVFQRDGIRIPADCSQERWESIHRSILLCRTASKVWLKQSRGYALEKWGVDYVAQTEIQMELALGIECKEEPNKEGEGVNASDKSTAIITIEGVAQQFIMWERKMNGKIPDWSAETLKRAIDILEPIDAKLRELRQMLADKEVAG